MGYSLSPDLQQRVQALIASGQYDNEEQVLSYALDSLEAWSDDEGDWPAIKEALDGIEAGTNKPRSVQEAFDEVRRRRGLV